MKFPFFFGEFLKRIKLVTIWEIFSKKPLYIFAEIGYAMSKEVDAGFSECRKQEAFCKLVV